MKAQGSARRRRRAQRQYRAQRTCTWQALLVVLWAYLGLGNTALASDFDAFQEARSAYEAADYALAAKRFESLVGGDEPTLRNPTLILESLKYLAVSHLFLGDPVRAKADFRSLLGREPTYSLDPMEFPEEVQRVFTRVADAIAQQDTVERSRVQKEAQQRRQAAEATAGRERTERAALMRLAATERVEVRRSRLPALMPFGIGQFQNGDDTLGALLAVSEGALVAASVVTYALHRDLDGQLPTLAERSEAVFRGRALRYSNQISVAMLAVVVAAGIVEAQLSFRPTEIQTRERPLPGPLQAQPVQPVQSAVTVHLGPTGVHGTF